MGLYEMNYKQCIEYIELNSADTDAPESGLERCREYLQSSYAGDAVSGKTILSFEAGFAGSLAMAYLEQAMKLAGVKTVLFSPGELGEYRNRWRVHGKLLSQKSLCDTVETIKEYAEKEGISFSRRQMEFLVAEGVFAQSDAKVLLTDYAYKPEQMFDGWELLRDLEAPGIDYKVMKVNSKRQVVEFDTYKNIQLGTLGTEAIVGACRALAVRQRLSKQGIKLEEKHLHEAMEEAYVTAGFGKVSAKPLSVVDGAESGEQVQRLALDVDRYLSEKQIVLIWGATKETEIEEMLLVLCGKASCVITVAPPVRNRIPSFDLASQVMEQYPAVTAVDSLEEAKEIVSMILPKDGAVLVVGCSELLSAWMDII